MTTTVAREVLQIGEMAGDIWKSLQESGPVTLSRLAREFPGIPRDLVMQGVGWLAREGKVEFIAGSRFKQVVLIDPVAGEGFEGDAL